MKLVRDAATEAAAWGLAGTLGQVLMFDRVPEAGDQGADQVEVIRRERLALGGGELDGGHARVEHQRLARRSVAGGRRLDVGEGDGDIGQLVQVDERVGGPLRGQRRLLTLNEPAL